MQKYHVALYDIRSDQNVEAENLPAAGKVTAEPATSELSKAATEMWRNKTTSPGQLTILEIFSKFNTSSDDENVTNALLPESVAVAWSKVSFKAAAWADFVVAWGL